MPTISRHTRRTDAERAETIGRIGVSVLPNLIKQSGHADGFYAGCVFRRPTAEESRALDASVTYILSVSFVPVPAAGAVLSLATCTTADLAMAIPEANYDLALDILANMLGGSDA